MVDAIYFTAPLILVFLFGYISKKAGVLSSDDGSALLRLIFYIGAPALVLQAILSADFSGALLALPFLPLFVIAGTLLVLFFLRRKTLSGFSMKTFGAMLVGVLIMNNGFLIPFVERAYGADGIARLMIIDAVNALLAFTLVYAIAVRHGSAELDKKFIVYRVLSAPAVWALLFGLLLRFSGMSPSVILLDVVELVSRMVAPAILLALGLKFTIKFRAPQLLIYALILRFGLGLILGLSFIRVFGLTGLDAQIALLVSAAPIGFNSITFSEMEKLDVGLAASQVSFALLVGLILVPVIIYMSPFII